MDWTTTGAPPPTMTPPTSTATEDRRGFGSKSLADNMKNSSIALQINASQVDHDACIVNRRRHHFCLVTERSMRAVTDPVGVAGKVR
jgi:hypothetical protein